MLRLSVGKKDNWFPVQTASTGIVARFIALAVGQPASAIVETVAYLYKRAGNDETPVWKTHRPGFVALSHTT